MGDELADVDGDAGQLAQVGTDGLDQLVGVAFGEVQGDVKFAEVDRRYLLADLAHANPLHHRHHLGIGQQPFLHLLPEAHGFVQGGAGQGRHGDDEIAFVKARQELPPQRGDQRNGRAQHGDGAADHPPRVPQSGLQHPPVDGLQPYAGGAFLGQQPITGQQQRAEYRGLCEGDQKGCEDGDTVRQPQRCEDAPFGAGQEKHRQENHHGDEGGVDDGGADFHRGAVDHPEVGVGHCLLAVFAQPPEDVLDVDDGVVNHAAEGHRHAAEGHGVDTDT